MTFWTRLLFGPTAPPPHLYVDADAPLRHAQKAEAEAVLETVQAQQPEVSEVAESLRVHRSRNHFGEAIERAMLRRDPTK